jgi:hypothetical protein
MLCRKEKRKWKFTTQIFGGGPPWRGGFERVEKICGSVHHFILCDWVSVDFLFPSFPSLWRVALEHSCGDANLRRLERCNHRWGWACLDGFAIATPNSGKTAALSTMLKIHHTQGAFFLFKYIECLPNGSDVIHVETDSIYFNKTLHHLLQ